LLGVVSTVESDDDMDRYCAIVPSLTLVAKKAMNRSIVGIGGKEGNGEKEWLVGRFRSIP
jgi:hypothetical protein